jgi:hypothetical protein
VIGLFFTYNQTNKHMLAKEIWASMPDLSDFKIIMRLIDQCEAEGLLNTPMRPQLNTAPPDSKFRTVLVGNILSDDHPSLPSGFYVLDVETVEDNKRLALVSAWDILNQVWWVWLAAPGDKSRLQTSGKILGVAHRASFEHSFMLDSFYLNGQIKWLDTHVMACNRYHPAKISLYRAMPYLPMFKGSNDLSLKELAFKLAGLTLDKDIVNVFIRAKGEEWRESYDRIHPDWVARIRREASAYLTELAESDQPDAAIVGDQTVLDLGLCEDEVPLKAKKTKAVKRAAIKPTEEEMLEYVTVNYPNKRHDDVPNRTKKQLSSAYVWETTPTLQELFSYNFGDVQATVAVFRVMWGWYRLLPYEHIAGLFHRSACFLPLSADWFQQTEQIESEYKDRLGQMITLVNRLEKSYIEEVGEGTVTDGLDWKVWGKTCEDKSKIGRYHWQGVGFNSKKLMTISRCYWDGRPLYLVREGKTDKEGNDVVLKSGEISQFYRWHTCDLASSGRWLDSVKAPVNPIVFDNPNNTTDILKDVTGVFSKAFLPYWTGKRDEETGVVSGVRLTSDSPDCQEVAKIYSTISYWQGFRKRVLYDLPIMSTQTGFVACSLHAPAGTVTNRAIDSILLTMSKPDHNKVGSELYNYICAPDGYSFVQADLDSIQNIGAALVAAVAHNYFRGLPLENIDCMNNEFSRVTILGEKSQRTTMAWLLARAMGLDNDKGYSLGKNALYAMIFGVGLSKLSLMLGDAELAAKNIRYMKGEMNKQTRQWVGGIASDFFNFLPILADGLVLKYGESFQTADFKSIFLQRKMPEVLTLARRGKDLRGTANNAVLQSLDVDCLNFMVTGITEKCAKQQLWAKYCQSVHDMKQFLCRDVDAPALAEVYQSTHREMIDALLGQMGIDPTTFPEKNKTYSGVEISKRWVKSLDDDGVTLSNLAGFDTNVTGSFATDPDCYDEPAFDDDFVSSKQIVDWHRKRIAADIC